ncbi:hypothetical protein KSS87_004168, partial [Heliosperma pusillum]
QQKQEQKVDVNNYTYIKCRKEKELRILVLTLDRRCRSIKLRGRVQMDHLILYGSIQFILLTFVCHGSVYNRHEKHHIQFIVIAKKTK